MAGYNPFKGFRRKQKLWLAILGVGTMISFIILPALMQVFTGFGGSQPNDVARSRRFGKVTHELIYNMTQNREALGRFYGQLFRNLVSREGVNQRDLYMLAEVAGEYERRLEEETLVDHWLLTQYAADQGIVIDRAMVVDHLTQLTGGLLTDEVFQKTLSEIGMRESQLEYLAGRELLRSQMMMMFRLTQMPVTPSTRWDWFQRLNREMTAEVAVMSVDAFTSKVGEPTEAQLKRFFDENRTKPFNPLSAETGFAQPNRVAFQYVRATPGQKLLDSVTNEEIEKYYEANKETMFRKPIKPLGDRPTLPTLPGQGPGSGGLFRPGLGGFTPGATPGATPFPNLRPHAGNVVNLIDDDASPATPAPAEEAKAEPKAEETKTETPKVEEKPETKPEEPKVEQPKTDAPAPTVPAPEVKTEEPKPAEESKAEESNESSMTRPRAVTRPVSFQSEKEAEETTAADPVKTEETKEEVKAEAETPAKAEEPQAEPAPEVKPEPKPEEPKAEAKAEEKAETETPAKVEEPKAEPTPEVMPEAKTEEAKSEEVDLSILFKPLSEVEGDIRRILAQEKADEAITEIEGKVRDYYHVYNLHQDQETVAPPMPDLTPFIEEKGLVLETVPSSNLYDAVRTEFARGMNEREYLFRLFSVAIPFEPNFVDGDSGRLLLWVTGLEAEHTPEKLDEVRDRVAARWKEVEARKPARQRAEEVAAEVRTAGKSLADVFGSQSDIHVVETEPFTWMAYANGLNPFAAMMQGVRAQPILGQVREKGVAEGEAEIDNKWIFAPGRNFMEAASALQVGETGVAFNQPENTVYVIRLTGSSPSEDSLWERFQTSYFQEYAPVGQVDVSAEAWQNWIQKIRDEVGFQWIQKPDELRRRR